MAKLSSGWNFTTTAKRKHKLIIFDLKNYFFFQSIGEKKFKYLKDFIQTCCDKANQNQLKI